MERLKRVFVHCEMPDERWLYGSHCLITGQSCVEIDRSGGDLK